MTIPGYSEGDYLVSRSPLIAGSRRNAAVFDIAWILEIGDDGAILLWPDGSIEPVGNKDLARRFAVKFPRRWMPPPILARYDRALDRIDPLFDDTATTKPLPTATTTATTKPLPTATTKPLPTATTKPLPSHYQQPLPQPLPSHYQQPLPSHYQQPLPSHYQQPLP
jgi:hypothetical protein